MRRAEELLKLADADIKTAVVILDSGNDELIQNNAAYHAEQAVEKIAKSVLEDAGLHGGIRHDIAEILTDMTEAGIGYPDWLDKHAFEISRWATTIRYNTNFKADHDLIVEVLNNARAWYDSLTGPGTKNM